MPRKSKEKDGGDGGVIVIEVGHRRCPPIVRTGFPTIAAALAWLRGTHCTGKCRDAGGMVIGFSDEGSYDAIRFCTPR